MLLIDEIKSSIRDVPGYPKPGVIFRDITPLLANPGLTRLAVEAMATPYRELEVDAVAAIEARGFIFGAMLARELNCAFIPVRKVGKLPHQTRRARYDLEYGTAEIEIHNDAFAPGSRVLIHDDVLATGGTASAAGKLVRDGGGHIVGFSFLINLTFLKGEDIISSEFGMKPDCLINY